MDAAGHFLVPPHDACSHRAMWPGCLTSLSACLDWNETILQVVRHNSEFGWDRDSCLPELRHSNWHRQECLCHPKMKD